MDPSASWSGQLILLIVLFFITVFFSLCETCFVSISKIKIKAMTNDNVKNSKEVLKLLDDVDKLISTMLIGNTTTYIAISSISASVAMSIAGNSAMAVTIAAAIVTVVMLIFGEAVPKTLAAKNAERVALKIVKPVKFVLLIMRPIVFLLSNITKFFLRLLGQKNLDDANTITEAELKSIVDLSHEEGVIKEAELEMINNVFDFKESTAIEVMTPRTDIIAIEDMESHSSIMDIFEKERFSRLPVYKEDLDHIIGVINFKDFIFQKTDALNFDIKAIMRDVLFSYETKEISELFKEMRAQSAQMAIILDEYGGTSGIVTIEDLMEEIVGEIGDEFDTEEEKIIKISDNEYLVDGMAKIDDFNEFTGINLVSEDFQSIGGYCIGITNDIPDEGDVIESGNIVFEVIKVAKNRIEELKVTIKAEDMKE